MTTPQSRIEAMVGQVVQTAAALAAHQLAPREAITVLASQVPCARDGAHILAGADARRARDFSELLRALAAALRDELPATDDPRDLRAVIDDLDGLAAALTSPDS